MSAPSASRDAMWVSGAALLGVLALTLARRRPAPARGSPAVQRSHADSPTVRAARRMNRAAGTLAASVLGDSAVEHYRGAFHNKAMIAPLLSATLSLAVSTHGNADHRPAAHRLRDTVYALAMLTGLTGLGFHCYNVGKRPGGFDWLNLFYGAPLGAPGALVLSGAAGYLAERLRALPSGQTPRIAGLPAGRAVAAATALGLLGTVAEVSLLHFRGAFHDPFMYVPVTLPPLTATALTGVALGGPRRRHGFTRALLRATAAVGLLGVGFHIFGVARNMGGWRNWSQNLLNGPPIPAPPSFTGLALAGLAALGLMREHPDA